MTVQKKPTVATCKYQNRAFFARNFLSVFSPSTRGQVDLRLVILVEQFPACGPFGLPSPVLPLSVANMVLSLF